MSLSSPESSEIVAAEIFVSGDVQGVGYRFFTQRVAEELRVSGWVRNLPEGRVQVEVEGPRVRVDELLARLRVGPPGAVVTDMQVRWKGATGERRGFSIVG